MNCFGRDHFPHLRELSKMAWVVGVFRPRGPTEDCFGASYIFELYFHVIIFFPISCIPDHPLAVLKHLPRVIYD